MEIEDLEVLERLAALRDAGALTEEQFAEQKAVLLSPTQAEFQVVLRLAGHKKIQVIKEIRGLTGLDLKGAKALVDNAPSVILSQVDWETAQHAVEVLEPTGALVVIE